MATARSLRPRLLIGALAVVGLGLSVASSAASAATPVHSDPVWYPLHVAAIDGCIGDGAASNPDPGSVGNCASDHIGYFGLNLDIAPVSRGVYPTAGVYAAGAGLVTAVVRNVLCGSGSAGNYVSIDHGGGIVSFYEHLATNVAVKVGQQVKPGTLLGYASNSGTNCAAHPYIDFVVRTDGGGYLNLTQPTNALKACLTARATKPQIWPTALAGSYAAWVDVPYLKLTVPASVAPCGASLTSLTYPTPATPKVAVATTSAKLTWSSTRTDSTAIVEQMYHPSTKTWTAPCSPMSTRGCTVGEYHAGTGAVSLTLKGLTAKREYRFRIARHNGTGWSPWSGWATTTTK